MIPSVVYNSNSPVEQNIESIEISEVEQMFLSFWTSVYYFWPEGKNI